jgi:hypothetical protein
MTANRPGFRLAAVLVYVALAFLLLASQAALASTSHQEGYPPPVQITQSPSVGEIPTQATLAPYPPSGPAPSVVTPIPIGGQDSTQATQNMLGEENLVRQNTGGRSLLYLWLGFIATLMIFGTCVIGATILFRRRNES